ncbi:hypothetical protein H4R24_002563 [Coemansia sp. RSA 988]|nr:hypothetical protein H4R24_002563 [Coemansia sp. RSA 988]
MNRTKDKSSTGSNLLNSEPELPTATCAVTKSSYDKRKEQVRLRVRRRRQRETAAEKERRLEIERLRAADRRQKESEVERDARRTDGRLRATQKRVNETVEESVRRKERNRLYMAERRQAARESRQQRSDRVHEKSQNYVSWTSPRGSIPLQATAVQQISEPAPAEPVHMSGNIVADPYRPGQQIHSLFTEHTNVAVSTAGAATAAAGFSGGFPSIQPRGSVDMINNTNNVAAALSTLLTEAPVMANVLIEPTISNIIPSTDDFRAAGNGFDVSLNSATSGQIDRLIPSSFYSTTGASIEHPPVAMPASLVQQLSSYQHINPSPLANTMLSVPYVPLSHTIATRGLRMAAQPMIPLAPYSQYHLVQAGAAFPSLAHYQQQPRTISQSVGMFSQTPGPNYSGPLPNYGTNIFYM